MSIQEAVYDLDTLARQNLHIHTVFSRCAKEEMKVPDILREARLAGLEAIALTDHFNDDITNDDYLAHIRRLREETRDIEPGLTVFIGSELSAFAPVKSLESEEVRQALDYRLYSCNHYHLDFWDKPEDRSPRGYVNHAIRVISSLLERGSADCVAHPLIGRFIKEIEDRTAVTREITDNELGDLLTLAKNRSTAFEINCGAILGDPAFGRRLWHTGREAGVSFRYGTDAHLLKNIDTKHLLPEVKKILG